MSYLHTSTDGHRIDLPTGKVVCVGRNYMAHIEELNNEVPDQAVLFHKPSTSLCQLNQPLLIPQGKGEVHNELEIAVLIAKPLTSAKADQVPGAIWGVGLGLDLTLRDVQSQLKLKGLPWERAKAFDLSCPVSSFLPVSTQPVSAPMTFSLSINNQLRQQGDSRQMIHDIAALIVDISQQFTLLPGDVVMTGTPKGVGPLESGDKLSISFDGHWQIETHVV